MRENDWKERARQLKNPEIDALLKIYDICDIAQIVCVVLASIGILWLIFF